MSDQTAIGAGTEQERTRPGTVATMTIRPRATGASKRQRVFAGGQISYERLGFHRTCNARRRFNMVRRRHSQQRGSVQLSVLMPTHRHSLRTCARIAEACSWAGPRIEVIVRDNSGDAGKRDLITRFQNDHSKVIIADPCDPVTNVVELLRVARGDFVYVVADDDFCFDRAIAAMPGMIDQIGKDASFAGISGAFVVEMSNASRVDGYEGLDSADARTRAIGYLKYQGPNLLFYCPVRRHIAQRVLTLLNAMPLQFPFHDQVLSLLYLLSGKFVSLQRFMYGYDMGVWENPETAQQRDLDFYHAEQLDPAINRLHWFLCAFEGAMLISNPEINAGYSAAQRQPVADVWFSVMYARFKRDNRNTYGSRFAEDAEKLAAKWLALNGPLSFDAMLTDIRDFIALFSDSSAKAYFDFWSAVLNKRNPLAREAAAAGA